jgi:hypothetical protein
LEITMTNNATTTTLTLATPDLRLGDLVVLYGMRIRLDTEPKITPNRDGGPTYAWVGTVENLQEVLDAGFIPGSFLHENVWVDDEGWTMQLTGRWNVQGNVLATWTVERAGELTLKAGAVASVQLLAAVLGRLVPTG